MSKHRDTREIPLFTLEGVSDAEVSTHYVTTGDHLGLSLLRFERQPCDDVVLLLHGLTTSTDMFVMPEQEGNLVSFLLDHGYTDVWSFDWRGSMRHSYDLFPTRFNLDDIALYDHPAAVDHIRRVVGAGKRLHVVCHCVGSITFMMSLFAGVVSDITSVVSNSVSLTPHVPWWSACKLTVAPFAISWILRFPNLNPRWDDLPGPGIPQGKLLAKMVNLFHWECDVPECHMISFMWGAGWPAAYEHDNLLDITHNRLGDLFGAINVNYYRHIRKMTRAQQAVKMYPKDPRYAALPDDYLSGAAQVTTPVLFMTGDHNRVFLDSNIKTYETLKERQPEPRNELRILPGYGHQDPFMGKNNHQDVFPHIVEFLDRHRQSAPAVTQTAATEKQSMSTQTTAGITFDETMSGGFALGESDPETGKKAGRKGGNKLALHGSIVIDDLEAFIANEDHPGTLSGSVDFTPWGTDMKGSGGVFKLFEPTTHPGLKLMVYELPFEHQGKSYYLAGEKDVRNDPIFDLWKQTTTLYTRLHEGTDKSGPVVGAGVLSLGVRELIALVKTLHATGVDGLAKEKAIAKFGEFFMGELWDSYVKHTASTE